MMFSVYKAIWVLLHTIFNIKDFVQQLLFIGKSKCSALWKGKQKANLPHDKYLIEQYKSCMKKIPQHLAVILGTEEPNFEALSKIVFWGLAAGIQHISFYDHKGVLVANNFKLYDYLAHWKKENDKIYWNVNRHGPCGSRIVYSNGMKKQLAVNFLSPDDGKIRISEICRDIAADHSITKDDINISYLDSRFKEIVSIEPELAIYFGPICCTYGLLPWHIRLTEFINIPSQYGLSVQSFLNALFTYSKCEQRLGF